MGNTEKTSTQPETEVVRFGDLEEGDQIIDPIDGEVRTIQKVYPEHIPETMYEITTSTGDVVEVSGSHLWYIIPKIDRELHRRRVREGKRLGKKVAEETFHKLLQLSASPAEEVSLATFTELMNADDNNNQMLPAVVRVAESIGHIAEENFYTKDLGRPDHSLLQQTIRMYDSQIFARQLLSLLQYGEFNKMFPLLVGRVVTTEEMLAYDDVTIPDPHNSKR